MAGYNNNNNANARKPLVVEALLTKEEMEVVTSDSFAICSNATLSEEKTVKLMTLLDKVKKAGYRMNTANDGRDELATSVFTKFELFSSIFLPFKGFNKDGLVDADGDEIAPTLAEPTMRAHKVAANYKYRAPRDEDGSIKYNSLNDTVKKFSARDVHLLLGEKCATKLKFLILNTTDGAEAPTEVDYKTTGSASFPIKIASEFGIPVFNIHKVNRLEELTEYLNTLLGTGDTTL